MVNVHNGIRFLRAAIDSVLAQSFDDFELVVVDDGSTDGTFELLQSYDDDRMRVLRNPKNLGIAAALNRGLEAVETPLVAHLDADDLALPGRFAAQVDFLDRHPGIAAVGSHALYVDEQGRPFAQCDCPTDPDEIREQLLVGCCLVHSSVTYRLGAVRAIGGYANGLSPAEDYDLWLRLSERFELAGMAAALAGYRVHSGQVSRRRIARQRAIADRCAEAARLRRHGGESESRRAPAIGRGLWRRARGEEGTLGADYRYWSDLYVRMGRPRTALGLAARGLVSSPLSAPLWRELGRSVRAMSGGSGG